VPRKVGFAVLRLRPKGAIRPAAEGGEVVDLAPLSRRALRPMRRQMQMIFQHPYTSLNPRMLVGDIIEEPLLVNGVPSATRQARVLELLDLVGLPAVARTRFPFSFSGGQRIGIARALALNPSLIVADEPFSALDVSVQAQIINLLLDLQDRLRLSMLFVAHDLGVARHVSDRVAVMYVGRIVETGPIDALYDRPLHPYTAALMASVPKPDLDRRGKPGWWASSRRPRSLPILRSIPNNSRERRNSPSRSRPASYPLSSNACLPSPWC